MIIPTYVLILYDNPPGRERKEVGDKVITKEQFDRLRDDFTAHLEIGKDKWEIKDRHWFWHTTTICTTAFMIIDAVVIDTKKID